MRRSGATSRLARAAGGAFVCGSVRRVAGRGVCVRACTHCILILPSNVKPKFTKFKIHPKNVICYGMANSLMVSLQQ
jgi:hypothetical protein